MSCTTLENSAEPKYNSFTWDLMSEVCLSPKNVPLSYYTAMDFGGFGAALSSNVKVVRVKLSTIFLVQ